MMSLSLSTRMIAPVESLDSLERRARVICFRLARGELVDVPAWDPVQRVLYDLIDARNPLRVRPGNAAGAVPEVL